MALTTPAKTVDPSLNYEFDESKASKPATGPVVVLIEDDPLILRMYAKKLELDGYNVLTAADGKAGLELITKAKPVVILCDVMMPEMNGFEVLEAVKAMPGEKKVPFIMLTNLDDEDKAEAAVKAGADDYLIKGAVLPIDVVAKVEKLLSKSHKHKK